MKNGWRMRDIDEMDMLGFLQIRAWDANREGKAQAPRRAYIDEVWKTVKP